MVANIKHKKTIYFLRSICHRPAAKVSEWALWCLLHVLRAKHNASDRILVMCAQTQSVRRSERVGSLLFWLVLRVKRRAFVLCAPRLVLRCSQGLNFICNLGRGLTEQAASKKASRARRVSKAEQAEQVEQTEQPEQANRAEQAMQAKQAEQAGQASEQSKSSKQTKQSNKSKQRK